MTTYPCLICKQRKPASAFSVVPKLNNATCLECKKEQRRIYRMKRQFGISIQDYDELFEAGGGVCWCCKSEPEENRRLCVDHDPETDEVRGLLCDRCNRGIGSLGDTIEGVLSAVDYLRLSE